MAGPTTTTRLFQGKKGVFILNALVTFMANENPGLYRPFEFRIIFTVRRSPYDSQMLVHIV
jgi:hypothetical protein